MKKCVVMSSMTGGGAEKMVMYIANELSKNKSDEIILILFKKEGENLSKLKQNIKIINLNSSLGLFGIIKLIYHLKKIKPSLIFISLGPLNAIFSIFLIFFKDSKNIARETNIPSVINNLKSKKNKIYYFINILYKVFYKFYDKIIVQSDDMKNDLIENYKIDKKKIIKINNLIDIPLIEEKIKESTFKIKNIFDKKHIYGISLGRLTSQKGFEMLIEKVEQLRNTNIIIYILGEGEDKKILCSKIKKLKLEEYIKILPFDENPYKYLVRSDFFIFPSKVEGFPNSLIEALGVGLPAIVNNFKGGANEIINENFNGKIVNFEDTKLDLKKEIDEILKYDRNLIKKVARQKYSKEKIIKKYLEILN